MGHSFFQLVRDAFLADFDGSLRLLDIKSKGKTREWHNVLCPACTDSSYSARISESSGFLQCFQCGIKLELFSWFRKVRGGETDVDARNRLAELLGVKLELPAKRKGGRAPREMTRELLVQAQEDLWTAEGNSHLRLFLESRKIANQEVLSRIGVGAIGGKLVIAQWTSAGALMGQHRRFMPPRDMKWSTGLGKTRTVQPFFPVKNVREWGLDPKLTEIMIFEGEWDGLTAWARVQLWRQNVLPFWINGVNSLPAAADIPEDWKGRRVDIVVDNDTFQGPDPSKYVAPDERKKKEMLKRREGIIEWACMLRAFGARVYLRAIPINPLDHWGGDYRDWVDAGGSNHDEIPAWPIDDVLAYESKATETVDFAHAVCSTGRPIRTRGRVKDLGMQLVIPGLTAIRCEWGGASVCRGCPVPERFSDGLIRWDERIADRIRCLSWRDMNEAIKAYLLHSPKSCPHVELDHDQQQTYWTFHLGPVKPESGIEGEILVYSPVPPPLSGVIEVEGRIENPRGSAAVMLATRVQAVTQELRLDDHLAELHRLCPEDINTVGDVERVLLSRVDDLAKHVTKIHGRRELHLAVDLVAHSALRFYRNENEQRGWLDACFIGPTRTGKSETVRQLLNYYEAGFHAATSSNVSRAGLTMGQEMVTSRSQGARVKPGIFPTMDGQLVVLDEFHYMPPTLVTELQNIRDRGIAQSLKNYGATTIPAAVRLITIANELRSPSAWTAAHVAKLYETPESLSRLDFALGVPQIPEEETLPEVEQQWTQPLVQALLRRAWLLKPAEVHIPPEVWKHAHELISEMAADYSEDVPLFTVKEKPLSLMRMAVSVANLVFSHPPGKPAECLVRKCHVDFAAQWLELTYRSVGYDEMSQDLIARSTLTNPLMVEARLGEIPNMGDARMAPRLLTRMFDPIPLGGFHVQVGMDQTKAARWLHELQSLGTFTTSHGGFHPTKQGANLMRKMIRCANNYPGAYEWRAKRLRDWLLACSASAVQPPLPSGVISLAEPDSILEDAWAQKQSELDGSLSQFYE